jgi:hypothetical protein
LHAAQRYDPDLAEDSGVMDRVISSYAPTIRALKAAGPGQVRAPARALAGSVSCETPLLYPVGSA